MQEEFDLGRLLGRREAFSFIGARCSAAEAVTLHEIREKKAYLPRCKDWEEFCSTHLHMSKTQANRIIRLLEEFGPGYFELAQLTRISAETYRAVEPVVKDHALHFNGEVITLDPENARRVAAAVALLRREAATKAERSAKAVQDLIVDIDRRFQQIVKDIDGILCNGGDNWQHLVESVGRMSTALARRGTNHQM